MDKIQGPGSSEPASEKAPKDPTHSKKPNKDFPKDLKHDGKKTEKKNDKPLSPLLPQKKDKGVGAQNDQKQQQQTVAAMGGEQQASVEGTSTGQAQATQGTSAVDKIVGVLTNNNFFGGQVSSISQTTNSNGTLISVHLSNGVEVNVNLHPGGQSMNITIQGLTAAGQEAADNQEAQMSLRQKLSEQDLVVHQITTVRAEGQGVASGMPGTSAPQGAQTFTGSGAGGDQNKGGNQGDGRSKGGGAGGGSGGGADQGPGGQGR